LRLALAEPGLTLIHRQIFAIGLPCGEWVERVGWFQFSSTFSFRKSEFMVPLPDRRLKRSPAQKATATKGAKRNFLRGGSLQPSEKARFGRRKPKKSKLFSLIVFAGPWSDFAGFGHIRFGLVRRRPIGIAIMAQIAFLPQ
jgi:hypothetical protein